MRFLRSLTIVAIALLVNVAQGKEAELRRFELSNGVKIVVAQAAGAPKQSTFTFLPLTMANDDAHRAQWSHLLEHMLIRAVDPQTLQSEGIAMNGETTHTYLRLESIADAAQWKQSLARHPKWLAARDFSAEVLEREKATIAQEEQTTAANYMTSKFALAAWNQVMVHGLEHAAVHGDVANATIEDLKAYADAKIHVGEGIMVASIGPRSTDDLRNELQRVFNVFKKEPPPPAAPPVKVEWNVQRTATWDLPTRHMLFHWRLPDRSNATMASATAAAQAINTILGSASQSRGAKHRSIAYSCVNTPGGPMFVIDFCVMDDSKPQNINALLRNVIRDLQPNRPRHELLSNCARMWAQQLKPAADLQLIQTHLPAHLKDNAAGVWLLGVMNFEYDWKQPLDVIYTSMNYAEPEILDAMMTILNAPGGWLMLEPAKAGEAPSGEGQSKTTQPGEPNSSVPATQPAVTQPRDSAPASTQPGSR